MTEKVKSIKSFYTLEIWNWFIVDIAPSFDSKIVNYDEWKIIMYSQIVGL